MPRLSRLILTPFMVIALAFGMAAGTVGSASAAVRNCTISTAINDRPVLYRGDTGTCVTVAQGLLANVHTYTGPYNGNFGPVTQAAVKKAQTNAHLVVTGTINKQTWNVLIKSSPATQRALKIPAPAPAVAATRVPAGCPVTTNRSICIDKTGGAAARIYAVEGKKVVRNIEARVGDGSLDGEYTPTGNFNVTRKAKSYSSSTYNKSMPYSIFFTKQGHAIHYSQDFHDHGYNEFGQGASHGCVNIGHLNDAIWLYGWTPSGAQVKII